MGVELLLHSHPSFESNRPATLAAHFSSSSDGGLVLKFLPQVSKLLLGLMAELPQALQ